jgi:hypothetical protein
VRAAKLFANRRVALGFLPQGRRVAEVGVAFGDFSEVLLAELRPAVLHAYDRFAWDDSEIVWGRPAGETLAGKTHRAFYEERFAEEIAAGVVALHEGDSREQLERAPDGFYDVIYIDAGRGYDAVKADAEVATRKLREAGHLVFNDYTMFDHIHGERYGVVPVVNELCVNDGWTVAYLALHPQMYCDICIRRVSGLLAP